MATFTVHVPPGIGDAARRADRTIFVRDGFSVAAFVLGPVLLLYRRLWLATAVWLMVAGGLAFLARTYDFPLTARLALFLVLAVLTGLEVGEFRRRALGRRGYITAAVLSGVRREAGEKQFFAQEFTRPASAPGRPPQRSGGAASGHAAVIGLFPQPGDGMPTARP